MTVWPLPELPAVLPLVWKVVPVGKIGRASCRERLSDAPVAVTVREKSNPAAAPAVAVACPLLVMEKSAEVLTVVSTVLDVSLLLVGSVVPLVATVAWLCSTVQSAIDEVPFTGVEKCALPLLIRPVLLV